MTTLEKVRFMFSHGQAWLKAKSQMDWTSHMSSDSKIQAELDANRRSGGYLQKQDFLERVGERRSGTFEQQLSKRR